MIVFGVDGARMDMVSKGSFRGDGHGRCCFAGADDDDPSVAGQGQFVCADDESIAVETEVVADKCCWIDGCHSGVKDGQAVLAPPQRLRFSFDLKGR